MSSNQQPRNFSGPEVCELTACEAVALLKSGELLPNELLEASWQRMEQVEPSVNATVIRNDERALKSLEKLQDFALISSQHSGWLAGLPIGIKDLIAVEGMLSTAGSPALADFIPEASDALVERLESRGAVIAGKTNTPEFGAGANTFNEVFGMTRNPWNTSCNAGGSSGGSAVSLATGEVWLSHGSDLAGSLRTPASFCGVVGFRPSPGRAGGAPEETAFALEATQGPMARNISDVALFLDAMAGFDPRHPISLEEPAESFQTAMRRNPGRIRIAFSEDQKGFAPVEKEIREILRKAMENIECKEVSVELSCPQLPQLYETYRTLRNIHYASVVAKLPDNIQKHFKPVIRQNADQGRALKAEEIISAMRSKTVLYHNMRKFLQKYDVLALPVTGITAGPVEVEYPKVVAGETVGDYVDWLRFSFLATTTALPALSMPVGQTEEGIPVGLQLIGPPRGEARLLQVSLAIEERLGLDLKPIDPKVTHV